MAKVTKQTEFPFVYYIDNNYLQILGIKSKGNSEKHLFENEDMVLTSLGIKVYILYSNKELKELPEDIANTISVMKIK